MSKSKSKSKSPLSVSLYSMFDVTVDSYGPIVEAQSDLAFFRSISHFILSNPDSSVALYADDFKIYRLGSFDKSSGMMTNEPEFLCTARSLPHLAVVSDTGAKQPQELSADPVSKEA